MIEASAPIRICDNGGWTDTWFGGPGRVLNIAVGPGVEVSIRSSGGPDPVVIDAATFGDRYPVVPGAPRAARHPLLEAAVDALPPPQDRPVEISVRSAVPAGCGAGTSAAVAVALLGALAAARGEELSPRQAAYAAHRLEVGVLGAQSGIQDQLSAAFGGINYLEIDHYPEATVHPLPPWGTLDSRLSLVFLGRAHDSSGLHRRVIEGATEQRTGVLSRLREAAVAARDAVIAQDLGAFGRSMIANTEAQAALDPELVGVDAWRVIETASVGAASVGAASVGAASVGAASVGAAIGWKVNGAGGDGGSLTLLSRTREAKESLDSLVANLDARYRVLPFQVSRFGLRVHGALG